MKVIEIPLDKIEQNENSRVVYKESDLSELMTSMKEYGLLQPVGVRKLDSGKYDAVFGNRRIVAAKKLGWSSIPAHIVEADGEEEREVLNLVENLKRQNTTLPEDGRIFQKLKDLGLKIPEIAARVGVTTTRIELALDAFHEIPKEYHKKLQNVGHQGPRKPGHISAYTSFEVMKLRKVHGLNRDQTRRILDFAKDEGAGVDQLRMMAPMLKDGISLEEAIGLVKDVSNLQLRVYIRNKEVAKLEKKTGKSINQLLLDYLETFPDAQIERRLQIKPKLRPDVKLRKAEKPEKAVAMGAKR